jgi:hypothetical protein
MSAVKRVKFDSDRMSYIILRGRWCHIIVLNVHAPAEDEIDDTNSFYEDLECVWDKFLNTTRQFCLEISMRKWPWKTVLNLLFVTKAYTKSVMIMELG